MRHVRWMLALILHRVGPQPQRLLDRGNVGFFLVDSLEPISFISITDLEILLSSMHFVFLEIFLPVISPCKMYFSVLTAIIDLRGGLEAGVIVKMLRSVVEHYIGLLHL